MQSDPELFQLVLPLIGPMTTETLQNRRRILEDLWVKSTAQDATPEDQAAFTPDLIAKTLVAAMQDNAKSIVAWALAIQIELHHADSRFDEIRKIQGFLATEKDKLAFCQRDPDGTSEVLQTIKANILSLEATLRALQEGAPVPRRSPYERPAGSKFPGHDDLAGRVPQMP